MENLLLLATAFSIAFLSALWLHPKIVRIARLKNITDNPDMRKLQSEPVPVLGGTVVFFGIVLGVGVMSVWVESPGMMLVLALMLIMLYTGTIDDIQGLSPQFRFCVEIIATLVIVFAGGCSVDDFHGLWNIGRLPLWESLPLTVCVVVGIINAINLIDGVDGLSSGSCIMACCIFGAFFVASNDLPMAVLAASGAGALIPFFVHNVFGRRSKMFIGDGGTLMLGLILAVFVLRTLEASDATVADGVEFGAIPFTLSVLSIPVFDTLRVMTMRIARGVSPFKPDKTHLHHAFIGMGFSHLKTTLSILFLNALIIVVWYVLCASGASVEVQFYSVTVAAILCTAGVYYVVKKLTER